MPRLFRWLKPGTLPSTLELSQESGLCSLVERHGQVHAQLCGPCMLARMLALILLAFCMPVWQCQFVHTWTLVPTARLASWFTLAVRAHARDIISIFHSPIHTEHIRGKMHQKNIAAAAWRACQGHRCIRKVCLVLSRVDMVQDPLTGFGSQANLVRAMLSLGISRSKMGEGSVGVPGARKHAHILSPVCPATPIAKSPFPSVSDKVVHNRRASRRACDPMFLNHKQSTSPSILKASSITQLVPPAPRT